MKKYLLSGLLVVLSIVLIVLIYLYFAQRSEMSEMVEQMQWEKEQLQEEYEELNIQFDGYQTLDIRNDSLQELLSQEQQRVQDLLEELRVTKATNARRIAQLKKELATVRAVMAQYVVQIDSLSRTNEKLEIENKQYKQQYTQVSAEAKQLQEEKSQLTEVVSRASMLEITNLSIVQLNKNDKKTRYLSHTRKLQIDYTIAKNITTDTGVKPVWLRLITPDGELLTQNESNVFAFENGEIGYSLTQTIEYGGQATSSTFYWTFDQDPQGGIYNADFFIDGNLVGSFPFELK